MSMFALVVGFIIGSVLFFVFPIRTNAFNSKSEEKSTNCVQQVEHSHSSRHKRHHKSLKRSKTRHYHKIIHNLYVGNAQAGYELDSGINPESFNLAINVAEELCDLRSADDTCDIMHFPMKDAYERQFQSLTEEILPILTEALQSGKKVLVFCKHGARRSVSTIIAFLLQSGQSSTYEKALFLFEGSGWETRISHIYERQLHRIQQEMEEKSL